MLAFVGVRNALSDTEPPDHYKLVDQGDELRADGDVDGAVARYELALDAAATDAERGAALYRIGDTLYEAEDYDGAIDALRGAASLGPSAPSHADALARLVEAFGRAGRPLEARAARDLLAQEYPDLAARWSESEVELSDEVRSALESLGYTTEETLSDFGYLDD